MLDPNFYINTPRLIISYIYPEKQDIMDFLIKLYNPEDDPTVPAYMSWKNGTGHEALYKIISDGNENIEKRGYGRHLVSVKSDSDSDSGHLHSDNQQYSPEDIAKFTPIGIVTMSLKRQPNGPNAPDVGFTFLKSFQGKGYAAEAVLALMEYYTESKGHAEFFGFTDETNVGANKLFARLGFDKRGVRNVKGIMYSGEDIIAAIWSKGAAKELEEYGI